MLTKKEYASDNTLENNFFITNPFHIEKYFILSIIPRFFEESIVSEFF